MERINLRKIIGGLMMMAGGLCGLWAGAMLFGKGVQDIAGQASGDGRPWGQILLLAAAAAVLVLGGKLLAGRNPPTDGQARP